MVTIVIRVLLDTNANCSPSSLVVGEEGKALSTKAWEETIDILRAEVPHLEELKGITPLSVGTSVSH